MAKHLILADLDNTLYDWARFFAPSFRAMVDVLRRELAIPEEQVYAEFKTVFARHGSLEYAFAIQELDSVRSLPTEKVSDLIRQGRGAFLHVQRNKLKVYPGVYETLKWLWDQDVDVVGITNSPLHRAQKRLYELRIDSFLTGLVAWEGYRAPEAAETSGFVTGTRERKLTRLNRFVAVPKTDCKPSSAHYAHALDRFAKSASEVWAIGDSLSKDLVPAARLGIKTIWAKYGAGLDPDGKDARTLLRITHWNASEIQATYSMEGFEPDHTIESITEIMGIVPATVPKLF